VRSIARSVTAPRRRCAAWLFDLERLRKASEQVSLSGRSVSKLDKDTPTEMR
jgi:hypothetical protein